VRDCSLGSAREDTDPDASLEPRKALAQERRRGFFASVARPEPNLLRPAPAAARTAALGRYTRRRTPAGLQPFTGRLSRAGRRPQRRSAPRREGRLHRKGLKRSGSPTRTNPKVRGGNARRLRGNPKISQVPSKYPTWPRRTPWQPGGSHGSRRNSAKAPKDPVGPRRLPKLPNARGPRGGLVFKPSRRSRAGGRADFAGRPRALVPGSRLPVRRLGGNLGRTRGPARARRNGLRRPRRTTSPPKRFPGSRGAVSA